MQSNPKKDKRQLKWQIRIPGSRYGMPEITGNHVFTGYIISMFHPAIYKIHAAKPVHPVPLVPNGSGRVIK